MWSTLPANTTLYRVTRTQDIWADVLQGYGAFYGFGGRYNLTAQPTVYASEDPLVALTEFGWHSALQHWIDLDNRKALTYPLAITGKLWKFSLNTAISLIDITSAACVHQFGYPAHAPYNPHPDRYDATLYLANRIRQVMHATAPHTRPEGLLAPSVRTPSTGSYTPVQVVLFVYPVPVVDQTLSDRGTLRDQWDIELKFETDSAQAVTVVDPLVAWRNPKYRLSGNLNSVPKYPNRPKSKAITPSIWHSLDIQYSPY